MLSLLQLIHKILLPTVLLLSLGLCEQLHAFSRPALYQQASIPSVNRLSLLALDAKPKKKSRGGRSSTGSDAQPPPVDKSDGMTTHAVPELMPPAGKTIFVTIPLPTTTSNGNHNGPLLKIHVAQVHDEIWWETSLNPYGAKCWPSSLAVAQYLASCSLQNRFVLELGCGNGLASIVAAQNGATVLATDISTVALSLTKQGYAKTSTGTTNRGTLSTAIFDITSSMPLPIATTSTTSLPPIVVVGAMLYDAHLAHALARRIVEAHALGAWIIIGDDDTGQREQGRVTLDMELARQLKVAITWKKSIVQCTSLGWKEKHIQLLQINASPPATIEQDTLLPTIITD